MLDAMDPAFVARHAAFVRGNRCFVLGAGFSAAAGVPLTGPLLAAAMSLFRTESPGLYARLEGYAREAFVAPSTTGEHLDFSKLSFADFCTFLEFIELREFGGGERWSDAGSREKLALKFYIAKTIVQATPTTQTVPELYKRFAEQLQPYDIVITYNWDCLLEAAFDAIGKPYAYIPREGAITIAKLHGSVNWRLGEPRQRNLDWPAFGFASGMMTTEVYHSGLLRVPVSWEGTLPLAEIEPLIVLPGAGKAFDVRSIAPLWYKPEWAFGLSHDIFILGLSLTPDDFFIRSFFLANLPYVESYSGVPGRQIHIVNPDPAVRTNYSFLLGQGNLHYHCEPFGESHLALMKPPPV